MITRILTQFEDLPQENLDYLLDNLGDVLRVDGRTASSSEPESRP
ncbi:MAG TPA: hypothetical protein VKI44_07170 [Acetobacteraceae bacterium]|nr:hypothetical protein [Acetobacteraceae bacterium]